MKMKVRGLLASFRNFKHFECLLMAFFALAYSLVFLINSPLHPWIRGYTNTDSSVFKTVALMMDRGYMPYRDSFDHKGPFLYLLNYLGNKLSYYEGIWFIEVFSLTVTVYLLYKIARLSCNLFYSVISVLLSASLLFTYFEGGNYSEEYAMPCIAAATYVFLDYLLNDKLSRLRIALAGACLGIVLMLRPNMIAIWIVFCIYVFIRLLTNKKYQELLIIIGTFVLGMALVILPLMIWLGVNHSLSYFWEDYVLFNMAYVSPDGVNGSFSGKWQSFLFFVNTTVFTISLISLLFCLKHKKHRAVNLAYLVFLMTTVALMVLSGASNGHYGMILVPAVVYPVSLLFQQVECLESGAVRDSLTLVITLYLLSTVILPSWYATLGNLPATFSGRNIRGIDTNTTINGVLNVIAQNTDADQPISVYGNYDLLYVLSKRTHATQYSFQFPIGDVMPERLDDYFEQLQAELPKLIIIQQFFHFEKMESFLDKNDYSLLWSETPERGESFFVYIR